jgi:CRP/FNR family transcriptional regulator, anaerobic regulatory protein
MSRSIRRSVSSPERVPEHPQLSERQKSHLAMISSDLRLAAGTSIYERGDAARWVFQVRDGVVKAFRPMRQGRPHVLGFLFPDDLFGLSERDRYANAASAVSVVTLRRAPVDQLKALLLRDPELEFRFICKLTHSLRRAQRQAIAVGRRTAVERVAMFISLMEQSQAHLTRPEDTVELSMPGRDVADFLQLSTGATRNALRKLERDSIIECEPTRIRICDRAALNRLLPDADFLSMQ